MRILALLAGLAMASTAVAQIPLPAFGSTFTSTLTRGFWFQAPVGFTITGLSVPNEALQSFQVVEVINLGAAPPAYPGTVVGTQLFYDNTTAAGSIIPCAIPVAPGDYIGILGACTSTVGNTTSYNSYASTAGAFTSSILGNPVTLTRFGTQSGISANGGNQPCWQEAAGALSRVDVYVGTGTGNFALAQPYGTGCYDRFASFYETFAANAFDLSNTSLQMLPSGSGYVVVPGTNQWFTPVAAPLALTDDSVSTAQPLGFTLNYPGGSTTDVYVSSNGFVWAQSSTANGCCAGDPITFLNSGARWAGLWNDLNPGVGGAVTFDTDPANGAAYVTFTNVPEYSQTANLNTFQFAFYASGVVELRWQSCTITAHTALAGWSPGAAQRNPGSTDLSAITALVTEPDAVPLALGSSARPIIGTSINLDSSNIPANSPLGAQIFGLAEITNGIDLGTLGMGGCRQYLSLDSSVIFLPAGGAASVPFTIPNSTSLSGVIMLTQSAAFSPGANALGIVTSNGVRLTIDLN
jgi:hypothetical protein